MALVKGTNCGFVTVAPVADPVVGAWFITTKAFAFKDIAPVGATKVIEIGWWCDNATEAANFEVGIYEHNVGDDNPEALVGKDATNPKGTTSGWKRVTGLNIPITEGNTYWIAVQLDTTATDTFTDNTIGAERFDKKDSQTTLLNPWGVSDLQYNRLIAFYAITDAPVGTNMKINISDVFKDIESLKINIGDAWKNVIKVQQNIGDVWKDVFG